MTLTLEQVKKAGRFAYAEPRFDPLRPDASALYEFTEGSVWARVFGEPHYVKVSEDYRRLPLEGWHHLPGCDCEFCRAPDEKAKGQG